MSPSSRPPKTPPVKSQWLASALLLGTLVVLSFFYLSNATDSTEREFKKAESVSISTITRLYANGNLSKITVRDNNVFAETASGTFVRSYKESRDSISTLGWNDPQNATEVLVENRETVNSFMSILPDILFFLLILGGIFWLFRGIARSQSNAMSFGKSKARIADVKQVKTRFKDVAG